MKELRFRADDGVWRVAFAFDPRRNAILLIAGDKSGTSQARFYKRLIATADARYGAHLKRIGSCVMVRALKEVLDALPTDRRAEIDRRFDELVNEVESLRELRRISEMSQARIAEILKISQPAVSKIEKQTDMYLSTLRSYVEAMGGELDVIVRLPNRAPLRVTSLEDVTAS
jgi:predicted XRE-type DNA-binding protein